MKKAVSLILGIVFTSSIFSQSDLIGKQDFSTNNTGFIENKGQIVDLEYKPNPNVLYLLNGEGLNVHLRQTGFSYDVYTVEKISVKENAEQPKSKFDEEKESYVWSFHRVDIELLGSNPNAFIDARQKSSDYINYYTSGTPDEGVLEVYNYQEVYYHNTYNKIDLQFLVKNGKPKYNFILHPGADIADIKLYFKGANRTSLTEKGEIQIETNQGTVLEKLPLSYYQETGEEIKLKPFEISENTFGIAGELSNDKTVVIDPIPTIVWNTFFRGDRPVGTIGSKSFDVVSKDSNVVIVGATSSTNNFASSGHQTTLGGREDAFVALFDSVGRRKWASYYGGWDYEEALGVTIFKNNSIFLCGWTESDDKIGYKGFKDTLSDSAFYSDAFVAKFDFKGHRIWATYYGGNKKDVAEKIVIDESSNIYAVGTTESEAGISAFGHQNNYGGQKDGFVVKFDSSGNRLWASYYGGAKEDNGQGIAVGKDYGIVISGYTDSDSGIFYNGHQMNLSSQAEGGYMVKFDSSGQRVWGTFYNGIVRSVAIDSGNNVYAVGRTNMETGIAFRAYKDTVSQYRDGFIAKFNSNGVRLWSTYYGGEEGNFQPTDEVNKVVVNKNNNNIYITGETTSPSGIASYMSHQPTYSFGKTPDAYLSKFDSSGKFIWGTYFGGKSFDFGKSVSVDENENIYITGWTSSSDFYGLVQSNYTPHQPNYPGDNSCFLARFTETGAEFSKRLNQKYCFGDTMEIHYRITGNVLTKFNSNNTFIIEVSDTNGSFKQHNNPWIDNFNDSNMSGVFKFKLLPATSWKSGSGYRLRLRSTNPPGYWELPDTISYQRELPKASFFGSMVTSCVDDNHLWTTNTSSPAVGMPTAYLWEFGNGDTSSSTSKYLNYTGYKQAGQYTVTLTLTDTFGCSHVASKVIEVSDNPIADFSVDSTIVCARDMLNLKDLSDPSSGTIKNWYWTFSDGKTSTWNNPTHSFDSSGIHSVKLKVRNNYGCYDSIEKQITVHPKPKARFKLKGVSPSTRFCFGGNLIEFENETQVESNKSVKYYWDFGDGDTSTKENPTKSYSIKQTFKPFLIAVDATYDFCRDTFQNFSWVRFEQFPVADFSINSPIEQCQKGNSFSFQNTSQVTSSPFYNVEWTILNQKITTLNTSGSFNVTGKIPVVLKITDLFNDCWDTVTKHISVVPSPTTSTISGATSSKGKKQETYSVANTSGSSYSWSVTNGTVVNGQGTSQVNVRWNENTGVTGTVSVTETSVDGCKGDIVNKPINLSPSSIINIDNKYNISLYPNPTNGELTVDVGDYKENYKVTVFNVIGKQVLSTNILVDNHLLNLQNLSRGIYLIKIEGEGFVKTGKIYLQ